MPFLKTPRGKFFYLKYSSAGPVVYLLHGLTSKSQDWETIPDRLASKGFQVFAFDMRGHGQSDKSKSGYAPEDLARDIEVCSRAFDHDKIHVVGHSTGGRNALFFATMFVQKTATLTILDQTLEADPESWRDFQKNYAEYPTPFVDEASLDQFLLNRFPDPKERRRKFEKGQFAITKTGQWDWNFSIPAALEIQRLGRAQALHWLLKRIQCPVLFLKGGDSSYVSAEEKEKITALLSPESFVVIENAGHGLFRDNPDAFLGVLEPFLRSNNPA